ALAGQNLNTTFGFQDSPVQLSHAYILVTDLDGTRYVFRAGPYLNPTRRGLATFGLSSAADSSNSTTDLGSDPQYMQGGSYGTLYPQYGLYLPEYNTNPVLVGGCGGPVVAGFPGSRDYPLPGKKHYCVTVADIPGSPATEVLARLKYLSDNVRDNHIPYHPYTSTKGANSNSFAFQLIYDLYGGMRPRDVPPDTIAAPLHGVRINTNPPKK